MMKHQQILEKLHAKMAEAIEDDIRRIVFTLMCSRKLTTQGVLNKLMPRWNCALDAEQSEVSENYKEMLILSLAVLLHKYGLLNQDITQKALSAIDRLNDKVALSDAFFHQTDKIKELINSKPIPITKKPWPPKNNITFYRAKDVISIQLGQKYCAAYIHDNQHNQTPIIEFYDAVFDSRPKWEDIKGKKAKGNSKMNICKYSIAGMKDLPDYANQIHLVEANISQTPDNSHLTQDVGLWTVSDIMDIQESIRGIFGNNKKD